MSQQNLREFPLLLKRVSKKLFQETLGHSILHQYLSSKDQCNHSYSQVHYGKNKTKYYLC